MIVLLFLFGTTAEALIVTVMARPLRFLCPYLASRSPPKALEASTAHLRLYSVLHTKRHETIPEPQWRQRMVDRHIPPPDHLYPRMSSQSGTMSCSQFREQYKTLQPKEVKEVEEVILRGIP